MKTLTPTVLLLFILPVVLNAQVKSVDSLDSKHLNWYNRNNTPAMMGVNVNKTWTELLADRQPKATIVVAVIDGGVDINHEDLRKNIWVNEDEIPNNKIDDDNNGYVDDIHGWNFIGNSKGQNINFENMEYTRIYRAGPSNPDYEKAKKLFLAEVKSKSEEHTNLINFEKAFLRAKNTIKSETGITVRSPKDLDRIPSTSSTNVFAAKRFLSSRYEKGFTEAILEEIKYENAAYLDYRLNLDFEPRKLVGDDPSIMDGVYGNPDVKGPRADHGTGVSGIIAGVRGNNIGIDGIADVKIMCLRSTPDGDERDKDVASSIRYAVDNGARIINMSFGKDFSPEKKLVDEAVRYAEQKNVLIVHGAGNDGESLDDQESFPTPIYLDKTKATNWITIGASDAVANENLPAVFSNYSKTKVDLFAPGVNIILLDTGSLYTMHDGTSLSAPVVSGVAALLLSYHPALTPQQLIDIMMASSVKMDKLKVLKPGLGAKRKKGKFRDLSKSGGVIDAYEAMKKADQVDPK